MAKIHQLRPIKGLGVDATTRKETNYSHSGHTQLTYKSISD
jgi:hypothetical protein